MAQTQDVITVHKALAALYESTNGGQWANNTGWDTTAVPLSMAEFNQWHGLRVVRDTLTSVFLPSNNLRGPIPPELSELSNLHALSLNRNNLTDSIPSELGNLKRLNILLLSDNELTGKLPRSFLKLQGLHTFYFAGNADLCAPQDTEFQNWMNAILYLLAGQNCASSVATKEKTVLPTEFVLHGNFPNPFNSSTTLLFDLPFQAYVSVTVFDMLGRIVYLAPSKEYSAGGGQKISLDMYGTAAGIYSYRITASGRRYSRASSLSGMLTLLR